MDDFMSEDSNGKEEERARIVKIIRDRLDWLSSMYEHEPQNIREERLEASIQELAEILKQIEKT